MPTHRRRSIGASIPDTAPRPVIIDSWKRSEAAGVDPDAERVALTRVSAAALARRLAEGAVFLEVARPHLEWLSSTHAAVPHAAFCVDRDGVVLYAAGTDVDMVREGGLEPGVDCSEGTMGTNGAGTPLVAGEPLTIEGAEHYCRALRGYTCTGAPVRGPAGDIIGAINVSTSVEDGAPERLLVVAHTAYAIAQELRYRDSLGRTESHLQVERRLAEERASRLAALEALHESEARYERIASNVPGMVYQFVYRVDGSKGYTFVSEGARTLFGVAPEAVLRDPSELLDLIHPEDRPGFHALALASATDLRPFRWEGRVVLRSGEERVVDVAARDQRLPDGSVVSDGLVLDITARKRAEQALRESEAQYRRLVERSPDGIIIHRDRVILYVNPVAARLVGAPGPEALVGRIGLDFIQPDEHARVAERMRTLAAGRATTPVVEQRWRRVDGSIIEVEVQSLAFVHEGRPAVQTVVRDITARKELEAQLRQAQKMEAIGQLAGGVAHDFNNLLTVINVHAELALEELAPPHPLATDIDEIRKAATRAAGLTRQLLAFGRKQVLQPVTLDLNQVVAETTALLRPLLGAALHLVTLPAPAPVPVFADRTQLEQVLMNLSLNARDAMPEGGMLTIEVGTAADDDAGTASAVLTVSDTGVGIPPEAEPRIFEPFFTTKPVGQGTGLGLATVHGIVEQSGGTIAVSSRVGAGTTFTITLPLAAGAPHDAPRPPAAAAPRHDAGCVLLVEDEEAVRAIARRVLERAGYHVRVARHGGDALRTLATHGAGIDVLLSDVIMPELGGVELARRAAERWPGLRIVLMSGYTDGDLATFGDGAPVDDFVQKPFTAESLLDVVRRAARRNGDER